jgi:taurine dioxygenase
MDETGKVEQLTPCIGAEVRGVDLGRRLDEDYALVRDALTSHHVVVVREQQLDDADLLAFAASFGEVAGMAGMAGIADQYVGTNTLDGLYDIDGAAVRGGATKWHTDRTFEPNPSSLGILAAKTVPDLGGDTVWSNLSAAYANLSPAFAEFLLPLDAEHTSAGLTVSEGPLVSSIHPVVTARPSTGEPVLYVNPLWTQRIVGLEPVESAAVLSALFQLSTTSPELELRHRWTPGDVVVWDMRSTLHRAVNDYGSRERVLRRASVVHGPPTRFGESRESVWPERGKAPAGDRSPDPGAPSRRSP